jgi:hypothetical protein
MGLMLAFLGFLFFDGLLLCSAYNVHHYSFIVSLHPKCKFSLFLVNPKPDMFMWRRDFRTNLDPCLCVGGGLYFFFIIISFFVLFAAEGDEFYKAVYHKEHVYCKSTMAWSNHSYSQR